MFQKNLVKCNALGPTSEIEPLNKHVFSHRALSIEKLEKDFKIGWRWNLWLY